MEPAHITLLIIGTISFTEAVWGVTAPSKVQDAVRGLIEQIPERNPVMGIFFLLLAAGLWLLMSPYRHISDWILVILSWIFAGGAYVNFTSGTFHTLCHILILDRTHLTLRVMYACEMIAALGIILIGLYKK